jgi:hypothetical protein
MEYLGLLVLIAGGAVLIYYIVRAQSSSGPKPAAAPPKDTPLQIALKQLTSIIDACQESHPHATPALLFIAASDGTVSRQELRIIIGFCERQGSIFSADWSAACEHLNAGININVTGGEAGARDNIADIADKPVKYRAAFLGAAEAIVACNRTTNATKQRLIEQVRSLV